MSTLKSSAEDLTLNADGSGNDIIIQSNASTKAIVTAEGTVGIGTDSPSRLLTLYGDTGIALQNSTTGTGTGNGTHIWVNSAGSGELLIQNRENSDIEFLANDTVRMRILAAGGLCFGTDTAAANALDDYEEGAHTVTFTPVTSGTVTLTGAQNTLGYTKIGRLVTITGEINVASVSSPVGGIRMSLPFVIAANATDRDSNFGSPTLAYSVPFSAGHPPSVYGSSNTSYVSLLFMSDNGAFGNYTPAAGESFFFSFSYITTA